MTETSTGESVNPYADSPRRARPMLMWGLALVGAAAVFGALVSLNLTDPFCQEIDQSWRDLVGGSPGDQNLLPVALLDGMGRGIGALILIAGPITALLVWRHWRSALYVLSVIVAGMLLVQLLKNTVDRPRPTHPIVDPALLDHGSLPSGHVAASAMIAVGIAAVLAPRVRRWWWIVAVVLVVAMAWQRTFVGAHWLSDTFAGAAVGAGAALILWWAFFPLIRRDFAHRILG